MRQRKMKQRKSKKKQIISKNPDLGDCRSYGRVIHECTWWIARTGNGIRE